MSDGNRDRRPRTEVDREILAYLETHPYGPTAHIGDAVRVSKTVVLKHLWELSRGGKVVSEVQLDNYTGRNCKVYAVKEV